MDQTTLWGFWILSHKSLFPCKGQQVATLKLPWNNWHLWPTWKTPLGPRGASPANHARCTFWGSPRCCSRLHSRKKGKKTNAGLAWKCGLGLDTWFYFMLGYCRIGMFTLVYFPIRDMTNSGFVQIWSKWTQMHQNQKTLENRNYCGFLKKNRKFPNQLKFCMLRSTQV